MNSGSDLKKHQIQRLISAGINESEAKREISILEQEVKDINKIIEIVDKRIESRIPIQYILGKAHFMDFEVEVNSNVLIPRPETELLIEETVKRQNNDTLNILDIGTGSGIIPIALAKAFPKCKIIAIDISKESINTANRNAIKNNVNEQINFKICDVFSKCFEGLINTNDFDLVISNPPYIKDEGLSALSPEVQHEPKIALTGSIENKSGLIYYERIIEICKNAKMIAFEIDPTLLKDLELLMNKHNVRKHEFLKDYSKLERFLLLNP